MEKLNTKWKWYKSDLKHVKKNHLKVFSTFSCGGGSSYGYKLAGYDLLGNVEIDDKINSMYVKNHRPKYNYHMDIRDFNKLKILPKELYNLDILDGSPPCSTFSLAGLREDTWGVAKRFREGQKKQVLDGLFLEFMKTVKKLNPKVVVAENVDGMTKGNSKFYITMVINEFKKLGYDVQLFRLNAMFMNVPQDRTRIFFIANRMNYPKLTIKPNEKPILFKEVASDGKPLNKRSVTYSLLNEFMNDTDRSIGDINKRVFNKNSGYTRPIARFNKVCHTITANGDHYREDITELSDKDYISVTTFPQDYNFDGNSPQYVCGMSVPPRMMEYIATEIYKQWFSKDVKLHE